MIVKVKKIKIKTKKLLKIKYKKSHLFCCMMTKILLIRLINLLRINKLVVTINY